MPNVFRSMVGLGCLLPLLSCNSPTSTQDTFINLLVSRAAYQDKLEGFWLGQCIANWTGLVTEMDKIGDVGEIKTGPFYTREDWGKPDQPNIWSDTPSDLSPTIDFVFAPDTGYWGADDDTDIEYIYQHLLYTHQTNVLSPEQIRDGWLKHIRAEEENYLWVSNQRAFDLMQEGHLPPATSAPENNEHHQMIDAQLTTEIFGFFAPGNPDLALQMAQLPIRTTARREAALIAEFYVIMYSLAPAVDPNLSYKDQVQWLAQKAREHLPDSTYVAKMYDFVLGRYEAGIPWEQTRDSLYQRYQVESQDGYNITEQEIYCNGCFAAGINFGAGMISLFYGEGNFQETIKIGALSGWDSDNPTATWGGLLGFLLGKTGLESVFQRSFTEQFNIHRTRQGFPNNGIDNFPNMARKGVAIIDRVVTEAMGGRVDTVNQQWIIPIAL